MTAAYNRMIWLMRWHIARFLIHAGLGIAPDGVVRDLLFRYLDAFSDEIMTAVHKRGNS